MNSSARSLSPRPGQFSETVSVPAIRMPGDRGIESLASAGFELIVNALGGAGSAP
jgi:hypothetical protein